jgi:hypothetical protein
MIYTEEEKARLIRDRTYDRLREEPIKTRHDPATIKKIAEEVTQKVSEDEKTACTLVENILKRIE